MEGNVLVFFDGTWDGDCPEETGRGETNVPRLHRLFVEDGNQRACYLPGVGTGECWTAWWGDSRGQGFLYAFSEVTPGWRRTGAPEIGFSSSASAGGPIPPAVSRE